MVLIDSVSASFKLYHFASEEVFCEISCLVTRI